MEKFRPQASGYSDAGASTVRRSMKGFTARSTSPNEDINWNNYTLRQRGRMLYMGSPIARSAVQTNKTKVVGTGLKLRCAIEPDVLHMTPEAAKEWQKKTEREFAIWANKRENCDAIGMNNFAGLQQLTVSSWLPNGDVIALIQRDFNTNPLLNPYSLRIHLIEADRICTPQYAKRIPGAMITDGINQKNKNPIYDGVEVDKKTGRVVAYWICSVYPSQRMSVQDKMKWQRVKAYNTETGLPNVLHIMDSERPDQYRGVSYLAPVIESLLNISRYTQSELMAALIQSFFTAWIKTESDPAQIPFNEVSYGDDDDPDNPPDRDITDNSNEYQMGPGQMVHLKPGEDVVFGEPHIPSSGFDTFVKAICKEIGAALEIPYDTLMKEFNASYSASRAALMEAWEAFRIRREWLISMFCQPVYEIWLAEAVALGRINAPGFFNDPAVRAAWCKAQWLGPVQGHLDPTKEVKADILAVQHGFKTHAQVAREYGGSDWDENMERIKQEQETLQEAGLTSRSDGFQNEPDLNPEDPDGGENNA